MQLKNLGDLFGSFGELNLLRNKYGKNSTFDTLSSTLQQSFNESFKVGKNGISEFSTEQIKTKASVMGLNDALTKQALSLANDAGLYQKAAAGNLTFSKAIELNINNASDLVDALMSSNSEVLKKYQDSDIATKIVNSGEKGSAAYNEFVKDLIDNNQDLGDSIVELVPKVETTKSAFSGLSNYFKGLLATFTNPIFLLTTAVTVGVAAWQGYNQSVQESIQHTKDSIAEIEERNKSIDDNISKAQELRDSLDSGTLTEQEAYNAKSQLLDIQSQLSDSYGEQADGIDLVNGKLDEQIEKMQQLKVENAKSWLNDSDNEKNYEKAKKKMTKDDYESFFGNTPTLAMLGSEPQKSEYTNSDTYKEMLKRYQNSKSQIEEIQKAAEKAGLKQYTSTSTGQFQLGFENETVTGADEKLNNFLATVKELKRQFQDEGKNTDYFDNIISAAEDAESSYKDILDKHQEVYQEYLKNSMLAEGYGNNKPATVYQQYADAVDKYNEALQSGDTSKVEAAKTALDGVKDSVDNIVSRDSGKKYKELFDEIADGIDTASEKTYEFKERLSGRGADKLNNTVLSKLKELKNYTDIDLKSINLDTSDVVAGKDALRMAVNEAMDLGIVSDDSAESVAKVVDLLTDMGMTATVSMNQVDDSFSEVNTTIQQAQANLETLNGYTVVLSNETQNIPCTSDGITATSFLIEIPFYGYEGIKQAACTVVVGELPDGITLAENVDSTSTVPGKITLNVAKGKTLGNKSLLTGTIVFTCTVSGKKISKKFTWIKSLAGKDGSQGIPAPTYYTWIRYADTPTSGISADPTNKTYIGIAYNQTSQTPSSNYSDYQWSKFRGDDGASIKGDDGKTLYVWIKYADDAKGTNMSDAPEGKTYIGMAWNKPTSKESTNAADYSWSLIKGADGKDGKTPVKGVDYFDGVSSYVWIRYATDAKGTGMTAIPSTTTGYIGTATTTTAVAPTNVSAYVWAKYVGEKGAKGDGGYIHIAYANSADGKTGFDTTIGTGKSYIGQYTDNIEDDSTNPSKYTWSLIKGADGKTLYTWLKYADSPTSGMSDSPAGKTYMGIAVNKTSITESSNYSDYT